MDPQKGSTNPGCNLCGTIGAIVECDKCDSKVFCSSCDDMYHRHPKRRFHFRKPFSNKIYSSKLYSKPELPPKQSMDATHPSKMPIPPPRRKKKSSFQEKNNNLRSCVDERVGYKPWQNIHGGNVSRFMNINEQRKLSASRLNELGDRYEPEPVPPPLPMKKRWFDFLPRKHSSLADLTPTNVPSQDSICLPSSSSYKPVVSYCQPFWGLSSLSQSLEDLNINDNRIDSEEENQNLHFRSKRHGFMKRSQSSFNMENGWPSVSLPMGLQMGFPIGYPLNQYYYPYPIYNPFPMGFEPSSPSGSVKSLNIKRKTSFDRGSSRGYSPSRETRKSQGDITQTFQGLNTRDSSIHESLSSRSDLRFSSSSDSDIDYYSESEKEKSSCSDGNAKQWTCRSCTFINSSTNDICEVCAKSNPSKFHKQNDSHKSKIESSKVNNKIIITESLIKEQMEIERELRKRLENEKRVEKENRKLEKKEERKRKKNLGILENKEIFADEKSKQNESSESKKNSDTIDKVLMMPLKCESNSENNKNETLPASEVQEIFAQLERDIAANIEKTNELSEENKKNEEKKLKEKNKEQPNEHKKFDILTKNKENDSNKLENLQNLLSNNLASQNHPSLKNDYLNSSTKNSATGNQFNDNHHESSQNDFLQTKTSNQSLNATIYDQNLIRPSFPHTPIYYNSNVPSVGNNMNMIIPGQSSSSSTADISFVGQNLANMMPLGSNNVNSGNQYQPFPNNWQNTSLINAPNMNMPYNSIPYESPFIQKSPLFNQKALYGSMSRIDQASTSTHEAFPNGQKYRSNDNLSHSLPFNKNLHQTQLQSGFEMFRILREAEKKGFTTDDVEIALNFDSHSPIEWLEENWDNMIETVMTMANNHLMQNEKKKGGKKQSLMNLPLVTQKEAQTFLRLTKGNIWQAIERCIRNKDEDKIVDKKDVKSFSLEIEGSGAGKSNMDGNIRLFDALNRDINEQKNGNNEKTIMSKEEIFRQHFIDQFYSDEELDGQIFDKHYDDISDDEFVYSKEVENFEPNVRYILEDKNGREIEIEFVEDDAEGENVIYFDDLKQNLLVNPINENEIVPKNEEKIDQEEGNIIDKHFQKYEEEKFNTNNVSDTQKVLNEIDRSLRESFECLQSIERIQSNSKNFKLENSEFNKRGQVETNINASEIRPLEIENNKNEVVISKREIETKPNKFARKTVEELEKQKLNPHFGYARSQFECELCAGQFNIRDMISMISCTHKACLNCLRKYFTLQIRESQKVLISCPFCKEPNINSDDEDTFCDYMSLLDQQIKSILPTDIHELFQRKIRDRTLSKDPTFRWCTHCSSGFIASNISAKTVTCPDCKTITCISCNKIWEEQHNGISCEKYEEWKKANDPKYAEAQLDEHLKIFGIDCPNCKFHYELSKGGCMHFHCMQCGYDFCGGCSKPFKLGNKCDISKWCERLGLHAHHPRNCLFYLRDKEIDQLQKLLDLNNIQYTTTKKDDINHVCTVIEQKEFVDGFRDLPCGNKIENFGLCKIHYIEYLGGLIYKNAIDPIEIFTEDELALVLKRENIALPTTETSKIYRDILIKEIKEKCPLNE